MSIQGFVKDRLLERSEQVDLDKKDGVTIYISRDTHLKLKYLALSLGLSKSALAANLVTEGVKDATEVANLS